jgi:hypothetical protein
VYSGTVWSNSEPSVVHEGIPCRDGFIEHEVVHLDGVCKKPRSLRRKFLNILGFPL